MSEGLRTKVEGWLEAMGCEGVERDDPLSRWHLAFEYPVGTGHRMLVAGLDSSASGLIVASVVTLSPEHLEGFEGLPDYERREFLFGLRRALNRPDVDFQLGGMDGPLDCPTTFQVSARRFEDGLGLDAFVRAVGAVYKTELEGVWHIQEYLDLADFDLSGPVAFPMDDMPQA